MTPDNLAEIKAAISDEQLRDMLASIPRHADGSVRATWVARMPAPIAYALVTELQQHRADPSGKGEAARLCATDGCSNEGTEYFERGGVGSHYCPECIARIRALASPAPAATVPEGVTVPKDILQALFSYGCISTVTGVIYPAGSHEDVLRKIGDLLSPTNTTESDHG